MENSTLKNGLWVGAITGVSRAAGFVRDFMIAKFLGAGAAADAFFVAFKIPNLFRSIFAEGAFGSVFIPLFSGAMRAEGEESARMLSRDVFAFLFYMLLFATLLCELAMPAVVGAVAPGFASDPGKFAMTVSLARITFPFMAFVAAASFFGSILNSLGMFKPYAVSPIILNLVMIAAAAAGAGTGAAFWLAWGVAAAGVIQLAMLWWMAARRGFGAISLKARFSPRVGEFFRRLGPGLLGAGIYHINILIGTIFATSQNGATSWIYYADRLNQLPVGIVGVAVATVMLPKLSRHARMGEDKKAGDSFNRSLALAGVLSIPAAFALAAFALPLFEVFFERGRFAHSDSVASARALAVLCAGMPALVFAKQMVNVFYARGDTKTPMRASFAVMVANLALTAALHAGFGYVGIVGSVSATNWLLFSILCAVARSRGLMRIYPWTVRTLVISAAASAAVVGAAAFAVRFLPFATAAAKFGSLAIVGAVGAAAYFAIMNLAVDLGKRPR
ncbi:MAG: murein biosynthesis integral membrane protein MurJ [Rickettsiales bacterium]|jgi:putative peptidoglycan lipid II flippase|nr:murein biosynthesis integral membrane protein MurJ [Rickettsiales bacterium]